jgi:uncharacterized protein YggE
MKYLMQLILIFLPLSLCYAEFDVPHVVVIGTAETEVTPDELYWNISIKSLGKTVVDVSKTHSDDVSNVLNYLKTSGLTSANVKTSRMQLNENMVYRNKSRLREGYFAFTSINFKTIEFQDYMKHWEQLANLNNLTINSVTFGLSNRLAVQDKTRIDAVKKAKEKAVSLAGSLGAQVLEPLLIEEIDSFSGAPRSVVLSMEAAGARDNSGNISPGREIVRARVKTVFRIFSQ